MMIFCIKKMIEEKTANSVPCGPKKSDDVDGKLIQGTSKEYIIGLVKVNNEEKPVKLSLAVSSFMIYFLSKLSFPILTDNWTPIHWLNWDNSSLNSCLFNTPKFAKLDKPKVNFLLFFFIPLFRHKMNCLFLVWNSRQSQFIFSWKHSSIIRCYIQIWFQVTSTLNM